MYGSEEHGINSVLTPVCHHTCVIRKYCLGHLHCIKRFQSMHKTSDWSHGSHRFNYTLRLMFFQPLKGVDGWPHVILPNRTAGLTWFLASERDRVAGRLSKWAIPQIHAIDALQSDGDRHDSLPSTHSMDSHSAPTSDAWMPASAADICFRGQTTPQIPSFCHFPCEWLPWFCVITNGMERGCQALSMRPAGCVTLSNS